MNISTIDLHTHTVLSGHAFSTLQEMAEAAAQKGVKVLGITEHCNPEKMIGAVSPHYFGVIKRIPKTINGVRCLIGVEANILNEKGEIDLPEEDLEKCGVVIASMHKDVYAGENNYDDNTKALCKAMENKYVQIIGHPYNVRYPCDIEKIAKTAAKRQKFLEINAATFKYQQKIGPETIGTVRKMIETTKQNKWYNIVNSDAHISYDIADFDSILEIKDQIGLDEKYLVNSNPEIIEKYFLSKK